jgi:hypothetical protein
MTRLRPPPVKVRRGRSPLATATTDAPRSSAQELTQSPEAATAAAGWRRWAPWVLIMLAALIALVSALNVWVKRQALSTDNWTQSSAQLLENSEIRNAVSVYLVDQLYENVDVGKALEQRLPPATKPLGPPLAAALEPALVRTANAILGRPRVQRLWEQANRRAHQLFMAVLNGKHGLLQTTGGNVVLNLRPMVEELAAETGLGGRLTERLPPDAGQIVVMKGSQLEVARGTVKTIRVLSYLLSFVVLGLFAGAIYVGRGRRRTLLMAIGVSVLVVGLLVLVARRLGGNYLVDALTSNPDEKQPVSAAWAIGTNLLRNVGINVVIYGVLTILAAWVAGSSRFAIALRRFAAPTLRDHPIFVYGGVTTVLLLVLLSGPTDGQRVYPLLLLFGLALVGTEILRRQTSREFPRTTPALGP